LYLAASMKAALMEAALGDVPSPSGGYVVSKSDLWGRGLVVTEVAIMNARFADLTSMGLRRLGVKDVTTCDVADYPDTRAWATWFYESAPLVDGLVWMSRQLNTDLVCVLFGGRDVAVTPTGPPRRLSDPSVWSEIVDLLTQLDVSLVP
jgi:hypothetical protein